MRRLFIELEAYDGEHVRIDRVDDPRRKGRILLRVGQRGRRSAEKRPEIHPDLELRHADLEPVEIVERMHWVLGEDVAEACFAVGDEFDTGLGPGNVRDLLAEFALQHGIHMLLALVDEAGRTTEGGDFRSDGLLAVGTCRGDLDGADAAAFQKLRQAPELSRREMLGVDAAAAALVQHRGPLVERIGDRRADALRMRNAHLVNVLAEGPANKSRRGENRGPCAKHKTPVDLRIDGHVFSSRKASEPIPKPAFHGWDTRIRSPAQAAHCAGSAKIHAPSLTYWRKRPATSSTFISPSNTITRYRAISASPRSTTVPFRRNGPTVITPQSVTNQERSA